MSDTRTILASVGLVSKRENRTSRPAPMWTSARVVFAEHRAESAGGGISEGRMLAQVPSAKGWLMQT
jgi:hypothetical protein